jgi:hypothetical protein
MDIGTVNPSDARHIVIKIPIASGIPCINVVCVQGKTIFRSEIIIDDDSLCRIQHRIVHDHFTHLPFKKEKFPFAPG